MANEGNLTTKGRLKNLTPEERKEFSRKGVEKFKENQARRKRLSELVEVMFNKKSKDKDTETGEFLTLKEKAVLQAVLQASQGDLKALELLARLTGEEKTLVEVQGLPSVNMQVFGFND